jgi:hypothetical protein
MRLRILSDGSPKGTRVVDAESHKEIEGVTAVEWYWSYEEDNAVPYCKLTIASVPLDAGLSNSDAAETDKDIL